MFYYANVEQSIKRAKNITLNIQILTLKSFHQFKFTQMKEKYGERKSLWGQLSVIGIIIWEISLLNWLKELTSECNLDPKLLGMAIPKG